MNHEEKKTEETINPYWEKLFNSIQTPIGFPGITATQEETKTDDVETK